MARFAAPPLPENGQAVIGGVITSSLLTLVVVPVIYCYLDDLAVWAKRHWRAAPK